MLEYSALQTIHLNQIKTGELLISELEIAENKLVKIIQQDYFGESESHVQLKYFCTLFNEEGLLRFQTKITRRKDEENFLCPKLIDGRHLLYWQILDSSFGF